MSFYCEKNPNELCFSGAFPSRCRTHSASVVSYFIFIVIDVATTSYLPSNKTPDFEWFPAVIVIKIKHFVSGQTHGALRG